MIDQNSTSGFPSPNSLQKKAINKKGGDPYMYIKDNSNLEYAKIKSMIKNKLSSPKSQSNIDNGSHENLNLTSLNKIKNGHNNMDTIFNKPLYFDDLASQNSVQLKYPMKRNESGHFTTSNNESNDNNNEVEMAKKNNTH